MEQDFPLGRSEQGLSGCGSGDKKATLFVLPANRRPLRAVALYEIKLRKKLRESVSMQYIHFHYGDYQVLCMI